MKIVYFFFLAAVVCASASTAAISASCTSSTASFFLEQFVPIVEKKFQNIPVGSFSKKEDGIKAEVNDLVINSFVASSASISMTPSGATVSLNGISIAVSGHYKVCEEIIGHKCFCDGGITIQASGTSLSVTVQITESEGVPVLQASNPQFNLGDFKLDGLCHLLDWIKGMFEDEIHDAVEKAVRSQMVGGMEAAASTFFASIPYRYDISDILGADFHLVGPVTFSSVGAELSVLGSVFDVATGKDAPFVPSTIPMPPPVNATSLIVEAAVSDSIPQGAAWIYFNEKQIEWEKKLSVNISEFEIDLLLKVNATKTPTVRFADDGLHVQFQGCIIAELDDELLALVIRVNADIVLDVIGEPGNPARIYARVPDLDVDSISLDFDIEHSIFGPVDPKWLKPILNAVLKVGALTANIILERDSFPIPVFEGVEVTDVVVKPQNFGYMTAIVTLQKQ